MCDKEPTPGCSHWKSDEGSDSDPTPPEEPQEPQQEQKKSLAEAKADPNSMYNRLLMEQACFSRGEVAHLLASDTWKELDNEMKHDSDSDSSSSYADRLFQKKRRLIAEYLALTSRRRYIHRSSDSSDTLTQSTELETSADSMAVGSRNENSVTMTTPISEVSEAGRKTPEAVDEIPVDTDSESNIMRRRVIRVRSAPIDLASSLIREGAFRNKDPTSILKTWSTDEEDDDVTEVADLAEWASLKLKGVTFRECDSTIPPTPQSSPKTPTSDENTDCEACLQMGKPKEVYKSHRFVDEFGNITCPMMQNYCEICGIIGHAGDSCPRQQSNE